MKAYHVVLWGEGPLRKEAFHPPRPGKPPLWKPSGGLWLSTWKKGWGPEWGIWWLLHYHTPSLKDLQAPVWEVDLKGLTLRKAGLTFPDFSDPKVDGWIVLPKALEAAHRTLPEKQQAKLPKWWTAWDVSTVWLRVWPEGRIRFLGTLEEVCPKKAVQALKTALE
ncbi:MULTISPECIES: hypothetical protein [Thermus]|uniref:hypothetical protein n=1 Tax=Thermus brockianus TaxID=56956 RepID=UPI001F1CBD6D|nr:hypothetical protein [Thermus brockianus]